MTLRMEEALAATFAPHLQSTFRLRHEAGTTDLELVEVTDASVGRHVSFSLVFRGPGQALFPQRIYPFEHERLGRFDLFVVPIRQDAHGLYYEAVVNRVGGEAPSVRRR